MAEKLMSYAFISYRSLEKELALEIAGLLGERKVHVWMDCLSGIKIGQDWRIALQEAIYSCKVFLALLSPRYVNSKYCLRELSYADWLNKPIVPLLIRPIRSSDFPLAVQGLQYLDLSSNMSSIELGKKVDELAMHMVELGLQKDSNVSYFKLDGEVSPFKLAEERLEIVESKMQSISLERTSVRLLRETLLKQIAIAQVDYEAVSEEFFKVLDPEYKNIYGRKMEALLHRVDQLEGELQTLSER